MNTKIILTIATISMVSGCSITSKFKNYEDFNEDERHEIYKEKNISEDKISLIESNISKEDKTKPIVKPKIKNKILKIETEEMEIVKSPVIETTKPISDDKNIQIVENPKLNIKPIINKNDSLKLPVIKNKNQEQTVNKFKMASRVDIESVFEIIDLKDEINSPHLVLLNRKSLNSTHNEYFFEKFKYLDETTTRLSLDGFEITIKRFIEKNKEFFEFRILKTDGNNQHLKKKVYELSMLKNAIMEADSNLYLKIVSND